MPATTRRRQVIGVVAAVAVVIGFAVLYLQSHNAKSRRDHAHDSVGANARRYVVAVQSALRAGPVTGRRLLALRSVYRDGGGRQQGIERVGGEQTGQRAVTVSFRVRVNFNGSFGTATTSSSCYRVTTYRNSRPPAQVLPTIDCRNLLPDIAPSTTLALP